MSNNSPFGFIGPQVPPGMQPPHSMQQPMPPPGMQPPPGMPPVMMDPSINNQPLQFNMSKGKPPGLNIAINSKSNNEENGNAGRKDNGEGYSGGNNNSGDMGGMQNQMGMPGPNMMGMGYGPMMGPMGMGDPSMMMAPMGYNQFGGFMGPMGPGMGPADPSGMQQKKEIITLKSCVLYPPPPNAPPPSVRERPPGCRTVFIGGLPENCTEEILREILERCGEISSIRMSKKNFAHVRFQSEDNPEMGIYLPDDAERAVDRAIYISGYRIKLDNKDDKENTGRLHVDYAQARDDLYEWECKQRALAREYRHRARVEEEMMRPPSPPPIIHFSEHEAGLLSENLKCDESFIKSSNILITWMERGDCSRRSANTFYSLIQSVNSHVRRLLNDKATVDQELEAMKATFRQRLEAIVMQFDQIEKVFGSASRQKAWDHFSKAQRKNLDLWKKQAQEIIAMQKDEFLKGREEAEMEMSDGEMDEGEPITKKKKSDEMSGSMMEQVAQWQLDRLREENDSLKCQLEAYKNEVELIKQEGAISGGDTDNRSKQIDTLQLALTGMQQQLAKTKDDAVKDQDEVKQLREQLYKEQQDRKKEKEMEALRELQERARKAKEDADKKRWETKKKKVPTATLR